MQQKKFDKRKSMMGRLKEIDNLIDMGAANMDLMNERNEALKQVEEIDMVDIAWIVYKNLK